MRTPVEIGRVVGRRAAARLAATLRRRGARLVFTNGVFDLLHVGHLDLLEKARALGDALVVGVNSDASVRRLKGRGRPIVPLRERMEMLAGLKPVDYVVAFGEDTPARIIAALRPAVLVKGADYRVSNIVGADTVRAFGGHVVRVRLKPGRSTTGLVARARLAVRAAAGRDRRR
ncbi:MAG TPA: D-glycero-beta-D-manno-heptose 1-phosphate adenylyltransferase [Candidatus Polarisedimenticolia bacterium]|nr:D-glycero-beta-D-manno-heptose 1-phosphate adenylyltransferase [Candidatus Polarisedimenticolia bacterium]